jgi:outer membrane protein
VEANGSYTRATSPDTGATKSVSSSTGTNPDDPTDQYKASIQLTQLLFDFGKTFDQYTVQDFNLKSSEYNLTDTRNQTIYNVKKAYYNVLQAKRSLEVYGQAVKQMEDHMNRAQSLYEVGSKSKIDVTSAEVDLNNAKLNQIKGENSYKTAVASLNNAMGTPEASQYELVDNLDFQPYPATFDDAIKRAYDNRPDLKADLEKEKAAKKSVTSVKKNYLPELTGNASYNWTGQDMPLADYWSVGLGLSVPLFNGFLTKYQVDAASANLAVARSNTVTLKQNIYLEVQQAYFNLEQAEKQIAVAELTQKQAQENLDLANGRYAVGSGSPIEVKDAEVSYSNAKLSYIQALSDYKVAKAALEKAMGEE